MARIPILQDPQQINTGNQTARVAQLPAVTNAAIGDALGNVANVAFDISEKAKRANDVTKLTEASLAMNQAQVDFATWQQSPEGQNEKDWLPKWQELQNGIKSTFDKEELTPDARLQLADRFSSWGTRGTIMVQANAFKQAGQRMDSLGQMARQKSIETGDMSIYGNHLKGEVAGGFKTKEQADLELVDADILYASRAAENQWKAAVMTADEKGLESSIQLGKERAGWDDDFIKVKRLAGLEGIERTKAVNKSKSEAEFLGEVFMRKAQGEVIVPSQIENWVAENKIDKDTGARLLVATKSEQGAMQGEFYDFLNSEVDQYDPMKDPDGVKGYEMQKKAAMLGLNGSQMEFFEARLNRAAKLNGPQRAQQSVLSAGKKVIGEMLKDVGTTRAWDSDAEILFKDKVKLEAFGIPKDAAVKIEKLTKGEFTWGGQPTGEGIDKAKALQLFKQNSTTRVAAKPAGLTDAEWGKLVTLSTSDVSVNPDASMSAEFNRAILEEGLESWYQHELNKRGTPPDEKEVRAWVGDKTRAVLQGVGAANLFKTTQAAPTGTGAESQRYTKLADGSYEGVASSYGYAGDADNGYNSLGMLRGEQPWYGELPTVALAPRMAEELGVQLPRKNKDGTWDWSKSVVEVEANNRKTKAIFDETGMYLVEASKNKLIDLTPEASDILGLPQKSNAKVIVRKPTL